MTSRSAPRPGRLRFGHHARIPEAGARKPVPIVPSEDRKERRRERLSRVLATLKQETRTYTAGGKARADTLIDSYNVHKSVGMDKRFDPDRTAPVIGEIGADVIPLQAADQSFGERYRRDPKDGG